MEAVWRSVVQDEFETLAASLWSSRIAKELEKRDFLTPKQIEDIQSTESSFAQGKQIVELVLKSENEEAFRIFCDCITESGCGDFLAQELRSKLDFKMKQLSSKDTDSDSSSDDPPKEDPEDFFAKAVKKIGKALESDMDISDLKLFSVTLTNHSERTGGKKPLDNDKVESARSVDEVFAMLAPYWSWRDFNILDKIVDISNSPKAQLIFEDLKKKKAKYLGEDSAKVYSRNNRGKVMEKMDRESRVVKRQFESMKTVIRSDSRLLSDEFVDSIRSTLLNVLDLHEQQLHFAGMQECDMEVLLWLVPEKAVSKILPLAYTNTARLREAKIQRIEIGRNLSYHVRDDISPYRDRKVTPELQQFRDRVYKVQEMVTDEWSLLQELHGFMINPGVSILDPCYGNYRKDMEFILDVGLEKIKLPPENEYDLKPGPEVIYTDQWPEHMWRCGLYLHFNTGPKIPFPMSKVSAVRIGSLIWCVSGWTHSHKDRNKVVAYNWSKKTFIPPVECPLYKTCGAKVGDHFIIIGGITVDTEEVTNKIFLLEQLHPTAHIFQWTEKPCLPPMPTKRYLATAVTWENYLIVAGGRGQDYKVLDVVEVLEIAHHFRPVWYQVTPLPCPLWSASTAILGHRIYITGSGTETTKKLRTIYSACLVDLVHSYHSKGVPNKREGSEEMVVQDCEDYSTINGISKVWYRLADMSSCEPALCVFNQRVCTVGGLDTFRLRTTSSSYAYNCRQNMWKRISGLHTSRAEHAVVCLPSRKLLVLGGWKGMYTPVEEIEVAIYEEYS